MTEPIVTTNILNVIYGLALFAGLFYALFLIFFQGLGDAFDIADITIPGLDLDLGSIFDFADPDIDLDADSSDISGLSMLALSSFVTAFGAFGIAANTTFRASPVISLLCAIIAGFIIGAAAQIVFMRVLSQTTSSNIHIAALKGVDAEVTIPISGAGKGQVAFIQNGQRLTLIACSSSATDIARGSTVIIDSVRDGVAFVSLDQDSDYF